MSKKLYFPVKSNQESLEYIISNHSSVVRFGDGEFDIISGIGIPYQNYDPELAKTMRQILATPSSLELLVCLPDVFDGLERYNQFCRDFWERHLTHNEELYRSVCTAPWYGSTFISRPYIDLEDKAPAAKTFELLKKLWDNQDILIVEGVSSKSGVGNDLFANAKSVERIICPPRNAFSKVNEIEAAIREHGNGKLVLLMLGPTAKVLVHRLYQEGFQLVDLGHIDSEYEWFKMGATSKIKLKNKHTAEFNYDRDEFIFDEDTTYLKQIVVNLSDEAKMAKKVSVIVSVQGDKVQLAQTLDNLSQQSYKNIEVVLVNNANASGAATICQEWMQKDPRFKAMHVSELTLQSAINKALETIQGEYFMFLRPTEWLELTAIEEFVAVMEKQANVDLVASNYVTFKPDTGAYLFHVNGDDSLSKLYSLDEWVTMKSEMVNRMDNVYQLLSGKLFRSKSLKEVRLPEAADKQSDFFVYLFYINAKNIYYLNKSLVIRQFNESDSLNQKPKVSWQEEYMVLLLTKGILKSTELETYRVIIEQEKTACLTTGDVAGYKDNDLKLKWLEK